MEEVSEKDRVFCVQYIYGGDDSWRAKQGMFHSDASLRYHLMTDGNQDALLEAGLLFMRGHRMATADPIQLAAAIVMQMKAMSKKRAARRIAA